MHQRPLYKTEGIVIKRVNIGEADKIVTLFTKEKGKIACIAKGIRKISSRRAPHIELFRHVLLTIHPGSTFDYITEASSITNGLSEYASLETSSYAYYLSEIIDKILPDGEPHEELFYEFSKTLQQLLIQQKESYAEIVHRFGHLLLRHLGYLAEDRELSQDKIQIYIESIVERPIRSHTMFSTSPLPA